MEDPEFYARISIATIMLWGFVLKLLGLGYRIDLDNGPDTAFRIRDLWQNSMKWRIMGIPIVARRPRICRPL